MNRPKEFEAFDELVDRVLAVPHSVVKERLEKQRAEAQKNPRKRGPKPKPKPSASARASSAPKK